MASLAACFIVLKAIAYKLNSLKARPNVEDCLSLACFKPSIALVSLSLFLRLRSLSFSSSTSLLTSILFWTILPAKGEFSFVLCSTNAARVFSIASLYSAIVWSNSAKRVALSFSVCIKSLYIFFASSGFWNEFSIVPLWYHVRKSDKWHLFDFHYRMYAVLPVHSWYI